MSGPRWSLTILALAASVIGVSAAAAARCPRLDGGHAAGRVFEDTDGDGVHDRDEPGLAGVSVSNGEDVVVTDAEGCYMLPAPEGVTLFVTQPASHALPVDDLQRPRFFHHHVPAGSPQSEVPGIAPTGKLPRSVDFPLLPRDDPDAPFDVLMVSDPQPHTADEVRYYLEDTVPGLRSMGAEFSLVLGDVMYDDLTLIEPYLEGSAAIGVPLFHVAGNHDTNQDATDDARSLETFRRAFGPPYYSFDRGAVHFVVLDTVQWQGRDEAGAAHYAGGVDERQLRWLRADLEQVPEDRLVVLAMHVPIVCHRMNVKTQIANREALFAVLAGRRVLAVTGHMHTTEHHLLGPEDGWDGPEPLHVHVCAAACGTWWMGPADERGIPVAMQMDGTPRGWHVYTFEGAGYRERYVPHTLQRDHQLRVSAPTGRLTRAQLPDHPVVINVFDGGPRTQVEAELDGHPLVLTREIRTDPAFEALFAAHPDAWGHWITPAEATHIWTAPLPPDLEPGGHIVHVTVVDPYGEAAEAHGRFVVEPGP